MPSKSPAQARLMAGVAHDPKFAAKVGISQSVGREFNSADKGTGILSKGSKGAGPQPAAYARGGAVLERSGDWKKTIPNRGFLDTPDRFRNDGGPNRTPKPEPTEENWKKSGGPQGSVKPHDKSEPAVKPRS